ncbi:MAG: DnaJ domain-containing protein [Myxococcota bacterium]
MNQNLYEILGVSPYSSTEEIKKAYKRLARTYHPDINKEEYAEEFFKKITYAYSVLADPGKRFLYDRSFISRRLYGFINTFSPIIKSLLQLKLKDAALELKEILLNLYTIPVDVSIEEGEIPRDTEKQIVIRETIDCPNCFGFNKNCKRCMGSGKIIIYRKEQIRIQSLSSIKGRVRAVQRGRRGILHKRILLNIKPKKENLSISRSGITLGLILPTGTDDRHLNVEILGRLFELTLPEDFVENKVLRLKRLIMDTDVNLDIKFKKSEKDRCAG